MTFGRFIHGHGWVQNKAGEGTDAGGGGAGDDTVVDDGQGGQGDEEVVEEETTVVDDGGDKTAAGGAAAAAPKKKDEKVEAPKDMKSAIDQALGYSKKADEQDPAADAAKKKAAEELAAKVKAAGVHANGKPKMNEKGENLDAEGKVVKAAPAKLKTSAELALKPEELKSLHQRTQARFNEVIGTLKQREQAFTQLEQQHRAVVEARATLFKVFEDARMTKDALGQYCLFNDYFTSGDPAKLSMALEMLNAQRVEILKALGKEEPGVDLLKDFPDLAKQVEDEEITRPAALEIAKARRDKAAREAEEKQRREENDAGKQSAAEFKKESDQALTDIGAWTAGLAKSDIDYKAKEDKLLGETLDGVLKDYPPKLWLPTLKRLYAGITVQRAPAPSGKGSTPLRPSGAKPGAKAPGSMLEAINAGLGYEKQEG